MRKICRVRVNGEAFSAYCGDLLLDSALMNGIDIPHDCRSGYCGTCRVRLLDGRVFGGATSDPDAIQACQGRIVSDLSVVVEEVPEVTTVSGRVTDLVLLAPDVVEVSIEVLRPVHYLPGQHYKVWFRGFPARCYSPTVPFLVSSDDRTTIRLHVRRLAEGRVSSALGGQISVGHRVKLVGPLGSAYFRPHGGRLVLVAGGTGFAPIWAIADAALRERADRALLLVVGARRLQSLYMIPALCRLARCRSVRIIPVVSEWQNVSSAVREGRPTDYLPALSARDTLYAAGAPAMVATVAWKAKAVGARCYADPFDQAASRGGDGGFLSRAADWLSGEARISSGSTTRPVPRRPERPRAGFARTAGQARPRATHAAGFIAPQPYRSGPYAD